MNTCVGETLQVRRGDVEKQFGLQGTAEAVLYKEPDNTNSILGVSNLARKRSREIRTSGF
jgi:hypothetical protein